MNYKLLPKSTILPSYHPTKSWFSILMAIGTIGVLLILVSSLAVSYIRESKLSRYSYDAVIASTAAEGTFEYAMLKIRNHRDGFQDAMTRADPDNTILGLSTPRSAGLYTEYNIVASSTGTTFTLSGSEHLIIPLFAATGTLLPWAIQSKNPSYNTGTQNTKGLSVSGISGLSWTITAMSGSESIAITGVGDISEWSQGSIRVKRSQCYAGTARPWHNAGDTIPCSSFDASQGDEELLYAYDNTGTVDSFLRSDGTVPFGTAPNIVRMTITDPYLIIYNSTSSTIFPKISSTTHFSLPTLTVRATATKWDSSQIFQFMEDKGKYYDALKYGVYNTNDSP